MIYKATITKTTELDDYKNGCDPDTYQYSGIIQEIQETSIDDLYESLNDNYDLTSFEYDEYNNCLVTDKTENVYCLTPSNEEIEQWKKGELDMWCSRYEIYIQKIERTEFNDDDYLNLLKECK